LPGVVCVGGERRGDEEVPLGVCWFVGCRCSWVDGWAGQGRGQRRAAVAWVGGVGSGGCRRWFEGGVPGVGVCWVGSDSISLLMSLWGGHQVVVWGWGVVV
jgi:hypothetical protein